MPATQIDIATKWMEQLEPPDRFIKHGLWVELWDAMRQLWPGVDTSARQLIHADYWPGNTLWKDGDLLAIIDWEWPALGEPTSDVAYFFTDAALVGIDIEKEFVETYEQASGRPLRNLLFWKMMTAAMHMPDPGRIARGYIELGLSRVTPESIRNAHSEYVRRLLS